jgi:hypothetical protein
MPWKREITGDAASEKGGTIFIVKGELAACSGVHATGSKHNIHRYITIIINKYLYPHSTGVRIYS